MKINAKHPLSLTAGLFAYFPVTILAGGHGVALMGQARGMYTFFGHLRWTPVIALGYIASIFVHMWVNATYF